MIATLRRAVIRTVAFVVAAVLLVGVPSALIRQVGWPLPSTVPDVEDLRAWLVRPIADATVLDVLAIAAWLLWAAFIHALVAEVTAAARGRGVRRSHGRRPVRCLAAALVTAFILGTVSAHAQGAPQARPVAAVQLTDLENQTITVRVGAERHAYTVKRGDSLSKISKVWLRDVDRWPEICRLNWHRHFPKVGGTLRDCDLIYPGWDLVLPADARPPQTVPKTVPPITPPRPPTPQPMPTPTPTQDPDGVVGTEWPSASPTSPSQAEDGQSTPEDRDDGVRLPDIGYLTWALVLGVIAAAALARLQRRRRFRPGMDPVEIVMPSPRMRAVERAVLDNDEEATPVADEDRVAIAPAIDHLPSGGVGLVGPGAAAAARGALVAALTSGGAVDPDRQTSVIIPAATLATLVGVDALDLEGWLRLRVADDLAHALAMLEAELLHRSRILDEHSLADLDTLRDRVEDEEALPQVLLVAEAPTAGSRMRARTTFGMGASLDVSAVLLGEWGHGVTVNVAEDGRTRVVGGEAQKSVPARVPLLETDATVELLRTLREAHTGEPAIQASTVALATAATTPSESASSTITDRSEARKAHVRVLGPPTVIGVEDTDRDLRPKALELAVYLACHPDGAPIRQVGEYLEPDARVRQADRRVHTNVSNLRRMLAGSEGGRGDFVLRGPAGYRLDPARVSVDLWELRSIVRQIGLATGERRRELLVQARGLCAGGLAEGQPYEWIGPYREYVRGLALEVHTQLAEELADDPAGAAAVLDDALRLDPYNEQVHRHAMRMRHAMGDLDGVRVIMKHLTRRLAEIDAEPEDETRRLAAELLGSRRSNRTRDT